MFCTSRDSILFKIVAIVLVCLFSVNNIALAQPADSTQRSVALAAESRLRPFFEKHGLDFQNLATVVYAAGQLKNLITDKSLRESHIVKLNRLFPGAEIEIEKGIKQGTLRSGRQYAYAVFGFKKEQRTINALFIKDHATLTAEELSELGIKTDEDKRNFNSAACPGLEGVWFVNPEATQETIVPSAAAVNHAAASGSSRMLSVSSQATPPETPVPEPAVQPAVPPAPAAQHGPDGFVKFVKEFGVTKMTMVAAFTLFALTTVYLGLPRFVNSLFLAESDFSFRLIKFIGLLVLGDFIGTRFAERAPDAEHRTPRHNLQQITRRALEVALIGVPMAIIAMSTIYGVDILIPKGNVIANIERAYLLWLLGASTISSVYAFTIPGYWAKLVAGENGDSGLDGIRQRYAFKSQFIKAYDGTMRRWPVMFANYWYMNMLPNPGFTGLWGNISPEIGCAVVICLVNSYLGWKQSRGDHMARIFNFSRTAKAENRSIPVSQDDPKSITPASSGEGDRPVNPARECISSSHHSLTTHEFDNLLKQGYTVHKLPDGRELILAMRVPDYEDVGLKLAFIEVYDVATKSHVGYANLKYDSKKDRSLISLLDEWQMLNRETFNAETLRFLRSIGIFLQDDYFVDLDDRRYHRDLGYRSFVIELPEDCRKEAGQLLLTTAMEYVRRTWKTDKLYFERKIDISRAPEENLIRECLKFGLKIVLGGKFTKTISLDSMKINTSQIEQETIEGREKQISEDSNGDVSANIPGNVKVLRRLRVGKDEIINHCVELDKIEDFIKEADLPVLDETFLPSFKDFEEKLNRKIQPAYLSKNRVALALEVICEFISNLEEHADKGPDFSLELQIVETEDLATGLRIISESGGGRIAIPDIFTGSQLQVKADTYTGFGIASGVKGLFLVKLSRIAKEHEGIEFVASSGKDGVIFSSHDAGKPFTAEGSHNVFCLTIFKAPLPTREGPALFVDPRDKGVRALEKEIERIHIENLAYTPNIPDKTIIYHMVADSILSPGQRNMLKTLEQEMMDERYSEKVVSLSVSDPDSPEAFMEELERVKALEAAKYPNHKVRFDVACTSMEIVGKIQGLGMQALAFDREENGDIVQVEGIILALRALGTGSVDNLVKVYRFLTGLELSTVINDVDELARMIIFVLPASKTLGVNEISAINKIIKENIKTAA